MSQTTTSQMLSGTTNKAARISIGFAGAFLVILFLLHFLEPEFDPSWRMISEYALGNFGWMMSLAFFCWGASVFGLLIALWNSLQTISGKIARGWMILIGIALFSAGIFKTNPILDTTISTENALHTLSGAFVILTFPIVASLISNSLSRNQGWASSKRQLLWGTLLVWFSQIAYFGSIIVSMLINPEVVRVGPEVYQGWPNRIMVVVYVTWLIMVARMAKRKSAAE
jgi:hypothetical protein